MKRSICLIVLLLLFPISSLAATGGLLPPDDSGSSWNIGDSGDDTDIYYRAGDKDSDGYTDIADLQQALITLGYLTGSADGQYGKGTMKAVKAFQRANSYDATGQVTYDQYWEILDAAESKQGEPNIQSIIDQINLVTDKESLQDIREVVTARLDSIDSLD